MSTGRLPSIRLDQAAALISERLAVGAKVDFGSLADEEFRRWQYQAECELLQALKDGSITAEGNLAVLGASHPAADWPGTACDIERSEFLPTIPRDWWFNIYVVHPPIREIASIEHIARSGPVVLWGNPGLLFRTVGGHDQVVQGVRLRASEIDRLWPKFRQSASAKGRPTKDDYPALEEALEAEIRLVGFPEKGNKPDWCRTKDAIDWVAARSGNDELSPKTLRNEVTKMLKRIRERIAQN